MGTKVIKCVTLSVISIIFIIYMCLSVLTSVSNEVLESYKSYLFSNESNFLRGPRIPKSLITNNICVTLKPSAFASMLDTQFWTSFVEAIQSKDFNKTQNHSTYLLSRLTPFVLRPPLVPANQSCHSPPSINANALHNCTIIASRKVGIMLKFGYDVDALEIHLHELGDTVDKFFLIESTKPHNPFVKYKHLHWDELKADSRFAKFSDKLVYFVMDDSDLAEINNKVNFSIWDNEHLQEALRWKKFMTWNNITHFFNDSDLLGFGDVDEIPNRNNVIFMKHCQLPSDPLDIGIWFPIDGTDTLFKTDHPVRGHPFTLGCPTYWTLGTAKTYFEKTGKAPTRKHGKSSGFLLGGMHLSRYAYPPFQMIKLLTCTECTWSEAMMVAKAGLAFSEGNITEGTKILNGMTGIRKSWGKKTVSLEIGRRIFQEEVESIVKVPWYLQCNRKRYPAFWKEWDERLN